MSEAQDRIERELTVLVRRAHRMHLAMPGVVGHVDRAAYGILGRLYDDGPMRLTTIATLFGLDVSTVSRQVLSLHTEELVRRSTDPTDRRATLIEVTPRGAEVLLGIRAERRRIVRELTTTWPVEDQERFGVLLERFNVGMADRIAGTAAGTGADETIPPIKA